MIRVVAPSRLHFGLMHVPAGGQCQPGERAFGGVGLMIDSPGVVVRITQSATWQFTGLLADRVRTFALRFAESLPETKRQPFVVEVERCPAEHTGLGVGTQLALAVGKALSLATGETELDATKLAERVGRGERSAIGIHGFDLGGLIVDDGKQSGERIAPLAAHIRLPIAWRVVLFSPPVPANWHGSRERSAFAAAEPGNPEALRRLAHEAIVPAARSEDLNAFGDAVHEFNHKAGEPFAAVQSGPYASPVVAELIVELRNAGIRGVGQSSWGPTVFAIVGDSDTAMSLVSRFGARMPAIVARISDGARV